MSYQYWNTFVDNWRRLPISQYLNPKPSSPFHCLNGWTNPNLIPLLNTTNLSDYSLIYLPEPWWGNDGNYPLHSVVINFNPGKGGGSQHYNFSRGLFGHTDYSTFVNNEVVNYIAFNKPTLVGTNKWHDINRARKIFNTFCSIGINLNSPNLHNHLSIELIPWHTQGATSIDFNSYIADNLQPIFENNILFAANESIRITSKLKNKVIIRMSEKNTLNLLEQFKKNNFCSYAIKKHGSDPTGEGSYFKFKINDNRILQNKIKLSDIEFISIWGRHTRNDFPNAPQLDWIFANEIK